MTRTHEIRPDLDEGIDRKVLSQLRTRFLKLNAGRLGRALEGLSTRQQGVLTLLPLFFHVNHPLLPGYVSGSTPAGLSNYEPDATTLAEAQRLTRSFSYKPRHGSNPPRPIRFRSGPARGRPTRPCRSDRPGPRARAPKRISS